MKRSDALSLVLAMVGLPWMVHPSPASASTAGQACVVPGATQLSDDQRSMLACLYYGPHSLIWNALASMPQYGEMPITPPPARTSDPAPEMKPMLLGEPMPLRPSPTISSPPPPTRSLDIQSRWQGWYAGFNIGYAGATDTFDDVSTELGGAASPENIDPAGGTAGMVVGYNRVTANGLFYGGEADLNYMNDSLHLQYMDGVTGSPANAKSVWQGYATMRGRLGFAFNPGLLFLTGGLAVADVRDTYSFPASYPTITGSSRSGLEVGLTAGAGAEFALTENISLSAEYLRLQMPTVSNEFASDNGAPLKFHLQDSANILRIGLNWGFY